jgi:hypothetical protein
MSFLANIGRDCDSINGLECAADGTDESGHDTCKSASMDEPNCEATVTAETNNNAAFEECAADGTGELADESLSYNYNTMICEGTR